MAIKDLRPNHDLVNEWDIVVATNSQVLSYTQSLVGQIGVLQTDPNFAINASPAEVQYINSLLSAASAFIAQKPINPDS